MDFRTLFVSLFASGIVWAIWFFIARKKGDKKQMIAATEFCCLAFIIMTWGVLCGAVCVGVHFAISYVKSELKHKEEDEETNPPTDVPSPPAQEKKQTWQNDQGENKILIAIVVMAFILFAIFFIPVLLLE